MQIRTVVQSLALFLTGVWVLTGAGSLQGESNTAQDKIEANRVQEVSLVSAKSYGNSFLEIELDAVVTRPDGKQLRVPAF